MPEFVLADPPTAKLQTGWAVSVNGETIERVGPANDVAANYPCAQRIELPGTVLTPGLINSHQHGRGLSQIQLGFPDLPLERWILRRRRRGAPNGAAFARLAAASMIANGVTSAVHANYAYGTGDYEAEARGQIDAYIRSGMRVTFCVGAQDRGFVVYPPFGVDDLDPLPAAAADVARTASSPYAADAASLLGLMDRLLHDFGDHPLVTLCWGPAGPQWVSDGLWRTIADHARANSLGIHLHCLESPAQAAVCERLYPEGTLRRLETLAVLGPRTVLAHGVHLTDGDIATIAATGAMVVVNPGSNLRLSNGIAPLGRLLEAGIPVALGTDNMSVDDDEDLLGELRQMAVLSRVDPDGAASVDTPALLAAVTTCGAQAMQHTGNLGRIAPGRPADLAAFDLSAARGPFLDPDTPVADALVFRASGRDVRLAMVAGRILWRDGRHTELDLANVADDAARAAYAARLSPCPNADLAVAALDRALARLYAGLPDVPSEAEREP